MQRQEQRDAVQGTVIKEHHHVNSALVGRPSALAIQECICATHANSSTGHEPCASAPRIHQHEWPPCLADKSLGICRAHVLAGSDSLRRNEDTHFQIWPQPPSPSISVQVHGPHSSRLSTGCKGTVPRHAGGPGRSCTAPGAAMSAAGAGWTAMSCVLATCGAASPALEGIEQGQLGLGRLSICRQYGDEQVRVVQVVLHGKEKMTQRASAGKERR